MKSIRTPHKCGIIFSGSGLKWIAMTAMLIDHMGLVLIEYPLAYRGYGLGMSPLFHVPWRDMLYYLDLVMRAVGRISFPIYCFLLAEGFSHTRDWRRYCLRLLCFAAISELPFSMACYNQWIGADRNVFLCLAGGLVMLRGFKRAEQYYGFRRNIYMFLVLAGALGFALIARPDYSVDGMLMIAAFYLLRDNKAKQIAGGSMIACMDSWDMAYGAGALAAVPLLFYSGEKGGTGNKYLFYWFYPVHLWILFLIRAFVLGVPFGWSPG